MSRRWSLLSGASFGRARTASRGGNRNDPNVLAAFDDNPLSAGDWPCSYRFSGASELPWQFSASATWQHQIGAPETTVVSVTSASATLAQGTQSVQVARRRRALPGRCAARFQSPAGLQVWRKGTDARFEVFNALDNDTITSWVSSDQPTTGPVSFSTEGCTSSKWGSISDRPYSQTWIVWSGKGPRTAGPSPPIAVVTEHVDRTPIPENL
jgi:hypothetical protein